MLLWNVRAVFKINTDSKPEPSCKSRSKNYLNGAKCQLDVLIMVILSTQLVIRLGFDHQITVQESGLAGLRSIANE